MFFSNEKFREIPNFGGRIRRSNKRQKHILFITMAENRDLFERKSDYRDRISRKLLWNKIVAQLNMVGPKRDSAQWRKCWTDLRLAMRKKWEKAQRFNYILNEYDRRVITACGMVDEYWDAEVDIASFTRFLERAEHGRNSPDEEYSNSNKFNENSHYLDESTPTIVCESEETIIKQEFEEEEEPKQSEDLKGFSVEFISDEEEAQFVEENIKEEKTSDEVVAYPIKSESPFPDSEHISLQPSSVSHPKNKSLSANKDLQETTLMEIRKMHQNLLKESKKQTSLLRRLVRAAEQKK